MFWHLYISESRDTFSVTYNALKGLFRLLLAIVFCLTMLFVCNYSFSDPMRLPFNLFFGILLLIFVISIPYSLRNIFNGNRGLIWGGNLNGLYLGGEFTSNYFYPWDDIIKITLVDTLRYTRDVDENYQEHDIALVEVKSGKNPITGNYSNISGRFDKTKSGSIVMDFEYPKNSKEEILQLLYKYSFGKLNIETAEDINYQFDK